MRKLLITLVLILVIIFTAMVVVKGAFPNGVDIWGVEQIKHENQMIDLSNAKLQMLTESAYPGAVKQVNNTAELMQKNKSEYESKAVLLSDKDKHMQTDQYEIEFLWTKIGNHALENNVKIKIDVTSSKLDGRYDLNFTVDGEYTDITQFIYDIENDSELGFKIEKFKMVPGADGVTATFSCTQIRIDLQDMSTIVTNNDQNQNEQNKQDTNTTNTNTVNTNTTNTTTNTNTTNGTSSTDATTVLNGIN